MKIWYKFLFLPILIFALVGCSDDEHESVSVSLGQYKARDGEVTQLQTHTIGRGVPIIIMCDRFSDKDITNGNYREATTWAMEGLFSVHPMKSLRDYFDVYEVTAVCRYENIVMEIIGEERLEDVTTIVLCNKEFRSSSTVGFSPDYYADIPTGDDTAYISFPFGEGPIKDYFDKIGEYYHRPALLHEAIGHCFAKLADEYVDDYEWIDPDYEKEHLMECQEHCVFRNVSLDSDVTKTYWADFAADSRYDFEKLVRDLCFGFDVFGRAMIYKRCMKIAYGDSWEFNYEDFVKFDLEKAKAEHEELRKQYPDYSKSMRSCAPPRFVKMNFTIISKHKNI